MNWTPEMQSISCGEREFIHDGPIETDPSHDLAHLLIAANGNLPWAPEGGKDTIKLAEYNAVFLEHLFANTYQSVVAKDRDDQEVFSRTMAYARWFVEKHFAPFPVSAKKAYCQFCLHINAETVAGLSPYFFEQKRAERTNPDYRLKSWVLWIKSNDWPRPGEQIGIEFKLAVRRHITRLKDFSGVCRA